LKEKKILLHRGVMNYFLLKRKGGKNEKHFGGGKNWPFKGRKLQ